ncbi:phage protein [Streptococcus pneumoniae]|nr:phage protein [Streptococcus pneumoniae]
MIPKFRGLSIDEKSKGEWQYGHLIEDRGRAFIINEVVEANEQYITIGSWCPVNPATLGQSTGLRDKNGKEVFIGDIVKCTRGCLHEVYLEKEYGGTFIGGMPSIYIKGLLSGYAWTEDEEIIGNVYENLVYIF